MIKHDMNFCLCVHTLLDGIRKNLLSSYPEMIFDFPLLYLINKKWTAQCFTITHTGDSDLENIRAFLGDPQTSPKIMQKYKLKWT